ncbi:MAG: STAS domain-containing protein [Acutalibacteraceae bacterium]|nr:STAS domain-containing protein [Acutalibacteraceae bacterium]
MNVNVQKDGTKLIISVEGKLGTTTAPALEKAVKENISGVTELVFDFCKLDYMASAGLRILLSSAKNMKKQGPMKIINVSAPVMEVFNLTGLADVMDIETA